MNKAILILVDGMRPDAIEASEKGYLRALAEKSTSSMQARTVFPSVTLPCHCSLFFSVDPTRHGITTNLWMPQVRPIASLADAVARAGKKVAFFHNWAELRDLAAPASLHHFLCRTLHADGGGINFACDNYITREAIRYAQEEKPDFVFLYLGALDECGHTYGWMTPEYMQVLKAAEENIQSVMEALGDEYHYIIQADHGGHDRGHGTEMPEDMTIPLIFHGKDFTAGRKLEEASIKDVAPTIATLLGVQKPFEWEGHSIL